MSIFSWVRHAGSHQKPLFFLSLTGCASIRYSRGTHSGFKASFSCLCTEYPLTEYPLIEEMITCCPCPEANNASCYQYREYGHTPAVVAGQDNIQCKR